MGRLLNWFKRFLGINLLEIRQENFESEIHDFEVAISELKENISHFQDSVNILHKTIESVVHIGTNIESPGYAYGNYGHSWAVICIEGKINIVKFVNLSHRDTLGILNFLKQFEAGRHCIDTPYQELFYDNLFKF